MSALTNKKLEIVLVFALGVVAGTASDYPVKLIMKHYFLSEYSEHIFECDNAMRTHFIAKATIDANPSELNLKKLQASELGLISCHEYDKFRKKLISYGLDENDLSEMGLKAIESTRTNLDILVREHEIRY